MSRFRTFSLSIIRDFIWQQEILLSLYAEANKIFLERRRFPLGFMYSLRIRPLDQHPAQEAVNGTRYQRTFENKPTVIPPFVRRYRNWEYSIRIDSNLSVASVLKTVTP